jgi:hypothetical protein
VRLIVIAAILSGAEVALPMLDGVLAIPQGVVSGRPGLNGCSPGLAGRVRIVKGEGGLRNATLKDVREE